MIRQLFDDDDDVYLRLQHGKGFHNLVYVSYTQTQPKGISDEHNSSMQQLNRKQDTPDMQYIRC
jgi:hypothetical protein